MSSPFYDRKPRSMCLALFYYRDLCFLRQEAKICVSSPFYDRKQRSVPGPFYNRKYRSVCQALSTTGNKDLCALALSRTGSNDLCVYCLALSHQEAKSCVSGLYYNRKQRSLCLALSRQGFVCLTRLGKVSLYGVRALKKAFNF